MATTKNIMINGMGELGRRLFRLVFDNPDLGLTVRRINDSFVTDVSQLAYLIKYDTVYGRWDKHTVEYDTNELIIDANRIQVTSYSAGSTGQNWGDCDVAIDCTGSKVWDSNATYAEGYANFFGRYGGIPYAVGCGNFNDNGATLVVFGENHKSTAIGETAVRYSALGDMISATQILEILNSKFGVVSAMVDEITAYQNLNNLEDNAYPAYTDTSQIGRAGAWNIIPLISSAGRKVGLVAAQLNGTMTGRELRAGTISGAFMNITANLHSNFDADTFYAHIKANAAGDLATAYKNDAMCVGYIDDYLNVSSDAIGEPCVIMNTRDSVAITTKMVNVQGLYDAISLQAGNAILVATYWGLNL